MFGKLLDYSRTQSDLYVALMSRVRELEIQNQLVEAQTLAMKQKLSFFAWILPLVVGVSVLLVLISAAVGFHFVPRYIRGLVLAEAQRQHAHGHSNGFVKSSSPHFTMEIAHHVTPVLERFPTSTPSLIQPNLSDSPLDLVKKKNKKRKKHPADAVEESSRLELLTPPRQVPNGNANLL